MPSDVLSVREAREQLPSLLDRFRGGGRGPVFLGAHRRTEAVLLSVEVYDELTHRDNAVAQALASLRAEGLRPSPRFTVIVDRWIHGDIDTEEMERQVRAIHGLA
jgi:hypothetical protein